MFSKAVIEDMSLLIQETGSPLTSEVCVCQVCKLKLTLCFVCMPGVPWSL